MTKKKAGATRKKTAQGKSTVGKKPTSKKTTAKKSAPKKTTAKKSASKKAAANKTTRRKTATRKKTVKKTSSKTAAKKTTASRKAASKKTAVKKKAARKTTKAAGAGAKPSKKKAARKDKLSHSEIKTLQTKLLWKRAMIVGDISKMEVGALRASEQDASTDNLADHGTDNYEQDFTLGLIENVEATIQQIDSALKKIEENNYGTCENCGCNIPKPRLQALPFARHCVKCQSELEKL
jgi:RNA polymerase-binding protein DksA